MQIKNSTKLGIIAVPDIEAPALTALFDKEFKLISRSDDDYLKWDYYLGLNGLPISGQGKPFEWKLWTPGRRVVSGAVREHFKKEGGFYGHVGAFIEWRRTCGLPDYHASIPDDNACWRRNDGDLYVPCSDFNGSSRRLYLYLLDLGWSDRWSFVGFRELS